MTTVALTGATGFIGASLCRRLLEAGYQVRALTRRERPNRKGLYWITGDLDDHAALAQLADGASHVIHCAGAVRGADYEAFRHVNVSGALNVFDAATRSSECQRMLVLSSLAAREPGLSWYARSKHEIEQRLTTRGARPAVTILRPPAVYGPGDRELKPLFDTMLRGVLPIAGAPRGRLALLHVDDLVEAMLAWLEHPHVEPGPFELHDGQPDGYTWPQIAAIAARARGGRVIRIPIPGAVLQVLASLNLMLARLIGRAPMLTPGKVRELRHPDWRCDNTVITAALGWQPNMTLERALATPEAWHGDNGMP